MTTPGAASPDASLGSAASHDDEFRWLGYLAARLPGSPQPLAVRREHIAVAGRTVSLLRWGAGAPAVVTLHGGGQNAHTWDSTLLALSAAALAIDLPGHGRSSWREDHDYSPARNAAAVLAVLDSAGVPDTVLVGMSLGGLTALVLAAEHPDRVRHLVMIDITPESGRRVAAMHASRRGAMELLADTASYASFDEIVTKARGALPGSSDESIARGVWHNVVQCPDGRWRWRADRRRYDSRVGEAGWRPSDHSALWDIVDRVNVPITLAVAARSGVVTAADARRFVELAPDARVVTFDTNAHAVQSACPVELAASIGSLRG